MAKRRNRKHSIIDQLPPHIKDTVEQMLLAGMIYTDIVEYLKNNSVTISASSVCRYAQAFNANLEMLSIASENFRKLTEEINKYPDLDTSEALIRLTSHHVLNALSKVDPDELASMPVDKLIRETSGLVRAAAHKKRIDIQNQESFETGLDAFKSLVFEAMSKENPDLYKNVIAFLNNKKLGGLDLNP